MDTNELKMYTKRAMDLEMAIFTQKNLMEEHKKIINNQYPVKPEKRVVEMPKAPVPPSSGTVEPGYILFGILGIVFILECLASIYLMFRDGNSMGNFLMLLLGPVGFFILRYVRKERKSSKIFAEQAEQSYSRACVDYPNLMEHYEMERNVAEKEYEHALATYKQAIEKYNEQTKSIERKHNSVLVALEDTLKKLYDENILFPKYRNLVAVSSLYEYFASGRCYSLDGPDGYTIFTKWSSDRT